MSFLLEFTLRASVILGLALVSLPLLRGQSAALRHAVLAAAVLCAALTPAVGLLVPAWDVPVRSAAPSNNVRTAQTEWSGAINVAAERTTPAAPDRKEPSVDGAATPPLQGGEYTRPQEPGRARKFPGPDELLVIIWTAGALFGLIILLAHSRRLSRIASNATPVRKGKWSRFADEICRTYGLRRRLRLLETSHPSVLATWGILRPDVLLPVSARDWSDERVRVVLSHELAHVRRCDWLVQIAAELLRALYWFNPLFWIACNRLRQESEQACDDVVLNLGVSNSDYAEHLLDLVRTLQEPASSWALVSSMARPSTLERRFRALLNPGVKRSAMTRLSTIATLTVFLAITIPVAAFNAATAKAPAQPVVIAAAPADPQTAVGAVDDRPGAHRAALQLNAVRSAIASLFTANPVQEQPSVGTAVVEGIVVKAGSSEAIPGATVELQRAGVPAGPGAGPGGPLQPLSATTGPDGRYAFQNIAPGDYRLVATRASGFVLAEYGQRSFYTRGVVMTLAAGQRFTDGRLAMTPTGSIAGRILDRDGEPVARAQVQALQPAYRDGRRYLNIIQSVQTNDLGEYRLFWLPPGPYYISARAEDAKRRQAPVFISMPGGGGTFEQSSAPVITRRALDSGEIVEEAFVVVYFPGTTDAQTASRIEVRPGESFRGIDFALTAGQLRARHVRGRIINGLSGQPSRGTVQIIPRVPGPNSPIAAGAADQNGLFDIAGVTPGSYYVYVAGVGAPALPPGTPPPPGANLGASGLAYIEVADADLENVTVVATSGFNIPGRIVIEGRPSGQSDPDLQRLRVNVNRDPNPLGLPPVGLITPTPAGGLPSGAVGPDGAFSLRNIGPGDYRVAVNVGPVPGLYVKSIRLGGIDLLSGSLRLEKAPEGEIDVVLGTTPGTLEGRVLNEKGEPAANVTVALVPDFPRRQRIDTYKNISTDASGRFRLQSITPGDYKVFAWDEIQNFAWQDAEFMRAYEGRGRSVHIDDGSRATAELTVITQGR
jgi:beta-lactamase regulating signal transducer with metallopeptidase domain